jgi:putative flavoprotein involved in K+ transport
LPIERVTAVVIGAGHTGLAVSRMLRERSIEHVVLERGEVANSWARERWDSLRLLTPSSQSRLPDYRYEGPDPDGFMTMSEVIDFIGRFAAAIDAPVRTQTEVTRVRPDRRRLPHRHVAG